MIIDLRYHVVSLVAVFLALGLGIIIGINLGRTVNQQYDAQITRLEQTYQKIRDDQRALQTSLQSKDNMLDMADQFQQAILPNLILNRLLGRRIAIIRTNDSVDFKYTKKLVDVLRQAGAEVTSVTTFLKPFDLTNPQSKMELSGEFGLKGTEDKALLSKLTLKTLQIIINGQNNAELLFLQNKEQLKLWGDYNRGYVDTLIFFGGGMNAASDQEKEIDQPLIEAARKLNVATIGVEPSIANQSYMRLYQSKFQATVDNVEAAPGEMTLVYLLTSGKKGHYGVKDTARQLIPEFKLNY